jgi:TRAP transporter TAXI family solute receptor
MPFTKQLAYLLASLCVMFGAVGVLAGHAATNYNSPINVTVTGAGAHGFVAAIIEAFNGIYRDAYPGSSVTFKPSGVAGGIAAVAAGKADVAFVMPPVEFQYALAGKAPFPHPVKGKIIQLFTWLDNVDLYFIATKEWADRNKIKTLDDIARVKPKVRLALNRKGVIYSNTAATDLFQTLGFSANDISAWGGSITWDASGPSLKDIRDGKIDLMIQGGFHPDGRIVDLNKTRPLVWLQSNHTALQKVADKLDMSVVNIPAGTYAFVKEDTPTLAATFSAVVSAKVSDETAYKMVKAIAEHIDRVKAIHPAFKDFSLKLMARKSNAIAYQPGAYKYYHEKGIVQ